MIRAKVCYTGFLVGAPYEINPRLFFWTSTSRNPDHTTVVPIKSGEICSEELLDVSIPLISGNLRQDDRIWVECFVDSPTQEGMYVGARAGCADLLLKEVSDAVRGGKSLIFKRDLILKQLREEEEDYAAKGEIELTISNDSLPVIKKWKFQESGAYDYVGDNMKFVDKLIQLNIITGLYPYSDYAESEGLKFEATSKNLESIHLPVWVSNLVTPAWVYWHIYSDLVVSELFATNLAQVSLDRHGLTRERFIKIADDQFSRNGIGYDEEFTDVVVASLDLSYILATSLFYKSDETYIKDQGYGFFGSKNPVKIGLESLNDPLRMNGDDCEGLGVLNHRTMAIFKTGLEKYRGNDAWNKTGGWRDPVLQRIQRVLFLYVSGGSLGSVTAARIGGEKAQKAPLFIDSYEDKHSELGAHMWQESIPVPLFEAMVNQVNSNKLQLRKVNSPPWAVNLPYCVGEGTGSVYPLLQPLSNYFPKRKEEKLEYHFNQLDAMNFVYKETKFLRYGQIQRFPKHAENIEDARVSNFYRRSTTFTTDELFKEGYPFTDFVWTQTEPRNATSGGRFNSRRGDSEWKWGVNMRDKVFANPNDTQAIGLIPVPPATEEQMLAIKSIIRHLPPLKFPELSLKTKGELENWALPDIQEFQVKVNSKTKGRTLDGSEVKVNVVFRDHMFFNGSLRRKGKEPISLKDGLLRDIANTPEIRRVNTVFEIITNDKFNVRAEVLLSLLQN